MTPVCRCPHRESLGGGKAVVVLPRALMELTRPPRPPHTAQRTQRGAHCCRLGQSERLPYRACARKWEERGG